jgi:hypothetical protein
MIKSVAAAALALMLAACGERQDLHFSLVPAEQERADLERAYEFGAITREEYHRLVTSLAQR